MASQNPEIHTDEIALFLDLQLMWLRIEFLGMKYDLRI